MKTKQPIEVHPPEFPEALRYLWTWFLELLGGLQGNGFSYPVIGWSDLDCWSRLTGQEVSPREARTIVKLGVMHANILSEKPKSNGNKN